MSKRLKHPKLDEISIANDQYYIEQLKLILKDRIANSIIAENDLIKILKVSKLHLSKATTDFAFNLLQRIVNGYSVTKKQFEVIEKAEEQISNYRCSFPPETTNRTFSQSSHREYESERYINENGDEVSDGEDSHGKYVSNYTKGYTTYSGMGGTISFDHETGEEC